jgi:hypothetical protein
LHWSEHKADQSRPSAAKVKNVLSFTVTPDMSQRLYIMWYWRFLHWCFVEDSSLLECDTILIGKELPDTLEAFALSIFRVFLDILDAEHEGSKLLWNFSNCLQISMTWYAEDLNL